MILTYSVVKHPSFVPLPFLQTLHLW
uniref:Uncharacterized protein n=1 Tax=Arundo donax TaxID=35708 RepID=A0A0A8ZNE2_ARUDO